MTMFGETVIRHPFTGWVTDDYGETSTAIYGPDVAVSGAAFAPGGPTEPDQGVDTASESAPTIYFPGVIVPTDPDGHDEWTVRGLRYGQDGPAGDWIHPWTGQAAGTVVKLHRRTG